MSDIVTSSHLGFEINDMKDLCFHWSKEKKCCKRPVMKQGDRSCLLFRCPYTNHLRKIK